MKKIFAVAAVVAALSFMSCGNKTNCSNTTNDSDSVSCGIDSAYADSLDSVTLP